MQTGPLVSVVMPSLNQVEFIGAAIDSVLGQDYTHLELVVSDRAQPMARLNCLPPGSRLMRVCAGHHQRLWACAGDQFRAEVGSRHGSGLVEF